MDQPRQAGELRSGGKKGEPKETPWNTSAGARETHWSSYQRSLTSSVTALSPGKRKKTCSEKMPVCNWLNKDQRKTAYSLSVSGLSSPLKSLTALIKHKQKSLPWMGYLSASATACGGSGGSGGGISSGMLSSGISLELRCSVRAGLCGKRLLLVS